MSCKGDLLGKDAVRGSCARKLCPQGLLTSNIKNRHLSRILLILEVDVEGVNASIETGVYSLHLLASIQVRLIT
jgi:hypothetical protein